MPVRLSKCALWECRVIVAESLGTLRCSGIPMEVAIMGTLVVVICVLVIAIIGYEVADPMRASPTRRGRTSSAKAA